MASACAVKPLPNGYMAAYHFASALYTIENITFRRMKVTRISDANDPLMKREEQAEEDIILDFTVSD